MFFLTLEEKSALGYMSSLVGRAKMHILGYMLLPAIVWGISARHEPMQGGLNALKQNHGVIS